MKSPREIDSLVRSTQKEVDEICPGKVHGFTMRREDGIYLVGQYWNDGISEWMEKNDQFLYQGIPFAYSTLFIFLRKWLFHQWERPTFGKGQSHISFLYVVR